MLYKKYAFAVVILICFLTQEVNAKELSNEAFNDVQISLLTYSPGEKIYSIFGHSAIRIHNPLTGEDFVYNYGTFNFEQPGFYLKFLEGKLVYSLSRASFERVKQSIIFENRSMVETPLILDSNEKIQIRAFLENNLLPENRDYRYDFFYDNCATRIIHLLNSCITDTLMLSPQVLPELKYRQLLDPYLRPRPWIHMGIDLLMGTSADKVARFTEPAFLPDYLHLIIKNYKLKDNKVPVRLSRNDIVHVKNYQATRIKKLTPSIILWPLFILSLISFMVDSYFRPLLCQIGNLILFITGLTSLLLSYLWIFSDHFIFRYNVDLLWLNPLLLIVAFVKYPKLQVKRTKLNQLILLFTITLVAIGIIASLIIERNLNLTALGMAMLVVITDKLRSIRRTINSTSKS